MNLKAKIKKLLLEGKSLDSITTECVADGTNEEIVSAYKAAKVEVQIEADEARIAAKTASDKEIETKIAAGIEAGVKKVLEAVPASTIDKYGSIKIDAQGKMIAPKKLSRFDAKTGVFVEDHVPSEVYGAFNSMLLASIAKDAGRAQAISNEIEQDNKNYNSNANYGQKAAYDPSVTDSSARGGYAVPTEVDKMIWQLLYAESAMMKLCNINVLQYDSKLYPLMYSMSVADIADQTTEITESQAVFSNPTVNMKRFGGFSCISNTLIRKLGSDVVNAFIQAYSSEIAKYLDLRLAVGNVTNSSDLFDGIVFDANTTLATECALAALTMKELKTIKNQLSAQANGKLAFVGNRNVVDTIGLLESSGGQMIFPQWVAGGAMAPFGIPLVLNAQIPSTLDVSADKRTTGTDDVLIVADFSKVVAGVSMETRIDLSDSYRFTTDVTTIRAVKEAGIKVISGTGTAGICAVALGLTN